MGLLLALFSLGFVIGLPVAVCLCLARLNDIRWRVGKISDRLESLNAKLAASSGRARTPASPFAPGDATASGRAGTPASPIAPGDATASGRAGTPASPLAPDNATASPECSPYLHQPPTTNHQPPATPMDMFWAKVEDWIAVKGCFAPKGMTREFAFVTRWLLRIGILLVVASVAYFLKLSIDRGWVGPAQRVYGTVAFGAVMCAAGAWTIRKTSYGLIGQALAAIGVAALYLGFGLGHRFFDPPVIASAALAFSLLAAVTVAGAVLAVVLDSPTVSLLSLLGAYLVPVIAGRDAGSPLMLDLYLLMVDIGIFAVARIRKWSVLDFLASLAAYLMCFAWCGSHDLSPYAVKVNVAFLVAVNFLYYASVVLSERWRTKAERVVAWNGLAVNASVLAAGMCVLLAASFGNRTAGVALVALGAAYAALAILARKFRWIDSTSVAITMFFSLAYLWIAPMLLMEGVGIAPSWCAIAIATYLASERTREPLLRNAAWLVLATAAFAGFVNLTGGFSVCRGAWCADGWLALTARNAVRIGCVPAAFGFLAWREARAERDVACRILAGLSLAFTFGYLTLEAYRAGLKFLPGLGGGSVTVAWGFYAFSLLATGIVRCVKSLRIAGLGVLGLAVFKLLMHDTSSLDTPWRVLVFGLTGAILMVGACLYIRCRKAFEESQGEQ